MSDRDWADAHLIHAAIDIHRDDPEFGFRFIADELPAKGITASQNRVSRLCTQQRLWSVHAKRHGLSRKPGRPVHDDLVERTFSAEHVDRLWLTDITEHPPPRANSTSAPSRTPAAVAASSATRSPTG